MTALLDARTLPDRTVLAPDLVIIGGGPAGISLALALADTKLNILLLESGGQNFDAGTQKMYAGTQSGMVYTPLEQGRLRFLGGSTNHWGGWCRPLDVIDFEKRATGCRIPAGRIGRKETLANLITRACPVDLVEAGHLDL